MTKSANPSLPTSNPEKNKLSELRAQLNSTAAKLQLQAVQELASHGPGGLAILMEFLLSQSPPSYVEGKAYEILLSAKNVEVQRFLQANFPTGVVPLNSERGIDYQPLQAQLAQQQFQAADQLTLQKLCELAGPAAVGRKWLYFSEVDAFPATDLQTVDRLWQVHSEGKFGFSVQRQTWLSLGKNWDNLWPKIGWRKDNQWMRYPEGFTWNLKAPSGHLPLSNQLRGVRVINALLCHPAWSA